jgi:hypothetical protein
MGNIPNSGCIRMQEQNQSTEEAKESVTKASDRPSSLLSGTLQNSDAIVRILDIHVLPLYNVLNIERQIRLERFLIIVYCRFFLALTFRNDRGLIANFSRSRNWERDCIVRHVRRGAGGFARISTETMNFSLQFGNELRTLLREDVKQPAELAVPDAFGSAPEKLLSAPACFN